MEGLVDLGYPAMHQPGVELAIFRSLVRRPNHYTTKATVILPLSPVHQSSLHACWLLQWMFCYLQLVCWMKISLSIVNRLIHIQLSIMENFESSILTYFTYLSFWKCITVCYWLGLHRIWLFKSDRSRIWPYFGTHIRPEPDLAETCFLVTKNMPVIKLMAPTMVSAAIGSTVQCFLCCVTVCQLVIKFVE